MTPREPKTVLDDTIEKSQTDWDYGDPKRLDLGPLISFQTGPWPERVYRRKPNGALVRVRNIRAVKRHGQ